MLLITHKNLILPFPIKLVQNHLWKSITSASTTVTPKFSVVQPKGFKIELGARANTRIHTNYLIYQRFINPGHYACAIFLLPQLQQHQRTRLIFPIITASISSECRCHDKRRKHELRIWIAASHQDDYKRETKRVSAETARDFILL